MKAISAQDFVLGEGKCGCRENSINVYEAKSYPISDRIGVGRTYISERPLPSRYVPMVWQGWHEEIYDEAEHRKLMRWVCTDEGNDVYPARPGDMKLGFFILAEASNPARRFSWFNPNYQIVLNEYVEGIGTLLVLSGAFDSETGENIAAYPVLEPGSSSWLHHSYGWVYRIDTDGLGGAEVKIKDHGEVMVSTDWEDPTPLAIDPLKAAEACIFLVPTLGSPTAVYIDPQSESPDGAEWKPNRGTTNSGPGFEPSTLTMASYYGEADRDFTAYCYTGDEADTDIRLIELRIGR